MSVMNRLGNTHNPYQGKYKKVLCVCSAGLLRSPTTALVLSQEPYNYNTRACGIEEDFALIVLDEVLIEWADEIVCMSDNQRVRIQNLTKKPVICLNISDSYQYRDPELIELIKKHYDSQTKKEDKKATRKSRKTKSV